MIRIHKDDSPGCQVACGRFPSEDTCPLCLREGAESALREAHYFAVRIPLVVQCPKVEPIADRIKALSYELEAITWTHDATEPPPAVESPKKGVIL